MVTVPCSEGVVDLAGVGFLEADGREGVVDLAGVGCPEADGDTQRENV